MPVWLLNALIPIGEWVLSVIIGLFEKQYPKFGAIVQKIEFILSGPNAPTVQQVFEHLDKLVTPPPGQ